MTGIQQRDRMRRGRCISTTIDCQRIQSPAIGDEAVSGAWRRRQLAIKRALDLGVAVPACILLCPIFAAVALAIKLDSPGPALFVQTRRGINFRPFTIVSDLARAYCDALAYLRGGGVSATLNCGYGRGFSVLEVIETVKRVCGVDSRSSSPAGGSETRHRSWRLPTVPALCSNGSRISTTCKPSCASDPIPT
jgi:hypothetical protein